MLVKKHRIRPLLIWSVRRIEKRERESPVDKRGGDGVGGNR
jgi:hypothetical protein